MKKIIMGVAFLVLFLLDWFLVHPHGHGPWWHDWKGSHLLLGVVGGIIFLPWFKKAATFFLSRKEDYYDL